MNADVAIITSIYGAYDQLKPVLHQERVEVDWVFVTDSPPKDSLGWRVVHKERPNVHPNRAAKYPKLFPWNYTDAPSSIWIDGSFRIISATFAVEAISYANPIAQFKHPWRDCLYQEAEETIRIARYKPNTPLIKAQADFYRRSGHPEHWGLWASGLIARQHTSTVKAMSAYWIHDIEEWSFQDQVSQPYSFRLTGLRPTEFPGTHFANPWIKYEGSAKH